MEYIYHLISDCIFEIFNTMEDTKIALQLCLSNNKNFKYFYHIHNLELNSLINSDSINKLLDVRKLILSQSFDSQLILSRFTSLLEISNLICYGKYPNDIRLLKYLTRLVYYNDKHYLVDQINGAWFPNLRYVQYHDSFFSNFSHNLCIEYIEYLNIYQRYDNDIAVKDKNYLSYLKIVNSCLHSDRYTIELYQLTCLKYLHFSSCSLVKQLIPEHFKSLQCLIFKNVNLSQNTTLSFPNVEILKFSNITQQIVILNMICLTKLQCHRSPNIVIRSGVDKLEKLYIRTDSIVEFNMNNVRSIITMKSFKKIYLNAYLKPEVFKKYHKLFQKLNVKVKYGQGIKKLYQYLLQ